MQFTTLALCVLLAVAHTIEIDIGKRNIDEILERVCIDHDYGKVKYYDNPNTVPRCVQPCPHDEELPTLRLSIKERTDGTTIIYNEEPDNTSDLYNHLDETVAEQIRETLRRMEKDPMEHTKRLSEGMSTEMDTEMAGGTGQAGGGTHLKRTFEAFNEAEKRSVTSRQAKRRAHQ